MFSALTWSKIVLLLLKVSNLITAKICHDQYFKEGYDEAVAEAASALLVMTKTGKEMMEKVNAMSSAEVDQSLRDLEPK